MSRPVSARVLRQPGRPLASFVRSSRLWAPAYALVLYASGCAAPSPCRPFLQDARRDPERSAFVERVPAFRAPEPPDDSSAALSSILRHGKKRASEADVEAWYARHPFHLGVDAQPVRCAWDFGLWAHASRGSPEDLKARLRSGLPVLVRLQAQPLNPLTRRYAVVFAYSDAHGCVLAHAGGRLPVGLPFDRFLREWRAQNQWMLVACDPDRPPWTLSAPEHDSRGQFREARGEYDLAVQDYEAAAEANPGDDRLYVRLGNAHRAAGRSDRAEAMYRTALRLNAENPQTCNNLAYLLAEHARGLDEAVALARRAQLLAPANPLVLDTLGYALYQQGNYAEASALLEKARARARWHPAATQVEIGMHLVWAHVRNGQEHLAREVLRDLMAIDPGLQVPEELQPLLAPHGG